MNFNFRTDYLLTEVQMESFREKKLLIVLTDDNPHDHHFIRACMAEFSGLSFISFFNGDELLDYLSRLESNGYREIPDLVLVDLNMPGLSGVETIESVSSNTLDRIRFAILSSNVEFHSLGLNEKNIRSYTKPHNGMMYKEVISRIILDYFNQASS